MNKDYLSTKRVFPLPLNKLKELKAIVKSLNQDVKDLKKVNDS